MLSKKMVITQLLGGLGNQMFQHAVGRRIAHDHGLELLVDDSLLMDHTPGRHAVNRTYDLECFMLNTARATPFERFRYNAHGLSIGIKIVNRLCRFLGAGSARTEKSFRFDEELLKQSKPPGYLVGVWQSYKYFDQIADLIRSDFSFRHALLPASGELALRLAEPTAVCLNVRRGDYVSDPGTAASLGFVGVDYYHRAAEFMEARIGGKVRYFVFSDDLEWCRQELQWLANGPVFIEHSHAGPKFSNYLQLMSLSANFVIPNSTFAWWAAWLSPSPSKRVVAPQRWFRDTSFDTSDLCPPFWTRL